MPKRKPAKASGPKENTPSQDKPIKHTKAEPEQEPLKEGEEEEHEEPSSDMGSDLPSSSSPSSSGSESDDDSEPIVSSTDEDEDDGEDEAYDQLDVEFEFFDPKESDFLGLKALLHAFLDGQPFDSSGLVNAVINQTAVGTVVKTSEEDDPIAVMTILNTQLCAKEAWLTEMRRFLVARCPAKDLKEALQQALDAKDTGLLINERLLNSPPTMAPPLVKFLFDELEGAAEDEDSTEAEREEFQYQRFLLCTRAYSDPEVEGSGAGGPSGGTTRGDEAEGSGSGAGKKGATKRNAKRQKGAPDVAEGSGAAAHDGAPSSLVYVRPEDEFLHRRCKWSFTFPVEGRPVSKGDLKPLRLVMCVEASQVPAARCELDKVVGNMAQV